MSCCLRLLPPIAWPLASSTVTSCIELLADTEAKSLICERSFDLHRPFESVYHLIKYFTYKQGELLTQFEVEVFFYALER